MGYKQRDFSDEDIQAIITMFGLGYKEPEIATYFGVHPKVIIRFLKRRDSVYIRQRCEQAKLQANIGVRQALFNEARGGDLGAIKYWNDNMDDSREWIGGNHSTSKDPDREMRDSLSGKSDAELVKIIMEGITSGSINAKDLKTASRKAKSKLPLSLPKPPDPQANQ